MKCFPQINIFIVQLQAALSTAILHVQHVYNYHLLISKFVSRNIESYTNLSYTEKKHYSTF